MTSDPHWPSAGLRISDEAAHRLLARAIELDQHAAPETPVATLRTAAVEAGISPEAFDRALTEWRSARGGRFSAFWRGAFSGSMADHASAPAPLPQRLISSALAFALFLLLYGVANRLESALGVPWAFQHGAQMLVELVGVGLALRLQARAVAMGLAGTAVAQLAGLVAHLLFGVHTVQGGPTQLALLFAGVAGVVVGKLLARRQRTDAIPPGSEEIAHVGTEPQAAAEEPTPRRLLEVRWARIGAETA